MSGLRYETGRDMPPGMQPLAADKIVQRLRITAEAAADVSRQVAEAIRNVMTDNELDRQVKNITLMVADLAPESNKVPPVAAREDPCVDCLRWGECNGVDEACPWRE